MNLFTPCFRLSWAVPLLALAGCGLDEWPENLPAHTYSGVVINSALGVPAPGAVVKASRPTARKEILSLTPVGESEIGQAVADANGHFTLRTTTGYADKLDAASADGRLLATEPLHSRDASDLRIVLTPRDALFTYGGDLDPASVMVKIADAAMNQIVIHAAAHPREPLLSLDGYAARGVISKVALDNFMQHPKLFFQANPSIRFIMGERLIQMQDTHHPLTLRGNNE